jgi:large subunit ribosomal protein L22
MQAVAKTKYVRMSHIKIGRVLSLIRGKVVEQALDHLNYIRKDAALTVRKTILSAVANLGNLEEGQRIDHHEIKIKEAFVTEGPTLKRFRPMSMGRAGQIRKRTSHLTIVVEDTK